MYFDTRLWQFTAGVRGRIALAILLGVVASALAIGRLAALGWLIGLIFAGAPLADLVLVGALGVGLVVARAGFQYAKDMVAHHNAAVIQNRLRRNLFDHIARLGPAYVNQQRTGDMVINLVEAIDQLEIYFGQYLPQVGIAIVTPVLLFAFLGCLDLPVALVFLAAALGTLFAPAVFHRWNRRFSLRRRDAYGSFAAEFLDAIQGLATLKAFGRSRARADSLAHRAREVFRTTMWVLASNAATHGITVAGIACGAAFAIGLGAMRVADGEMALATLIVVLILGTEAFRPLRELSMLLHYGMVGLSSAEGIARLFEAKPAIDADPTEPPSGRALEPTIAFDGVTFAYPGGRQRTHAALDFEIRAGERVAIVGPSGSGKSSIVKLLLRFYDPQQGAIRLGGVDLRELPIADLRRHVALVSQDTALFHGTVEDNLRLGKPDATREELEAAAKAANAHGFITALPQGYATLVGERGVKLSGGQRQRIAIARALLRDAPVLVLDEALSAVDAENEAVIQEALDRLMKGRTTLIFAHRLSSVIGADRILALDEGRIAEAGTHAELMARRGPYWRLMAEQAREAAGAGDRIMLDPPAGEAAEQDAIDQRTLEPTDAILRAEGMSWVETFRVLLGLVRPWKAKLCLSLFLGIARVLTLIGVGVAGGLVVMALRQGEPFGVWLVALAILAPATAALHWLESWVSHDVAFRLLAEMRIALFEKLDRLAPAYLTRRRTGDLVGVATHDVELIEYFFAHTIAPAFVAVLVPGGVLLALAIYGWPLALALAPFLLLVAVTPFLARRSVDRAGARSREAMAELNAHAVDSVQGLGELAAFQRERARGEEFDRLGERYLQARLPFHRDLTVQKVVLDAATGLGGLAVVAIGAGLVAAGSLEAAALPLLALLAMASFLPVAEIAEIGRRLSDTLAATRRLYAIHIEPVPVRDGPGVPAETVRGPASVRLETVTFTYPGRVRAALDRVGFEIGAGRTVAIVGPSGAGKTTVAQLLLRFWDPDEGRILLDGSDMREWRLDDLRSRVALVAQDTYLFNDTLRANVLIAKPEASEAELAAALERAALTDFVDALPDGLDTMVGERGTQLSGGQRQRVAIARAFLKDAPILVLDEATSHLDAVSELAVRRALDRLMADRTTVVIAHRLSTVRDADRIVVMEDGRLIEQGSHEELLARGGLYARLVARQLAGAAA